ncbi:MAG: hypothetical protein UR32_C0001G0038 [candidate division WS6 bacterium GW2011_GWE2_33_157]|uniref:Prepilin-type N-terminal cleavage/methylation domain-containing protein n=1 Tax=candidate division WS6 bacterium GW2011_GWB1_33_6 TaxID=1619088 RepID=A0A0G0AEZ0_9BACT|nr:MAG: hypothetical protein UR32_C0001G0038 [candidate division WS6 bacterium GW2011_GWE2_33_157]KKP45883.1 MAG: hypothetical protein UR36_C0003G0038 [candidate division WS6 bacterium GW2011_GWF1_33_233]KKP55120.1 MAG: hypothetical protein UR45_C0004G0015 [candidate division WS6 bacterium GW2011_WS6_33_547]KKP55344.1 MAG: hypothetical protein UR47_C0002G0061 [candidate division WS6 bacterium GW2011_GWB1_33_6]KKP57171.1 MAG: hypothetical protein UR49_C0002G0039 [candidate division WS6 bacterium
MGKNLNKKQLQGFSLFELLVVMGILLMLSALVFPLTIQKTQESKLESYASQLTTDIRYQQQRSSLKNMAGGISLGSNQYTLFDGESLASATDTDIKKYPTNIQITSVSLTNGSEIFFPSGEFKPLSYGTLVVTDGRNSIRVYINMEGLIGYEKL